MQATDSTFSLGIYLIDEQYPLLPKAAIKIGDLRLRRAAASGQYLPLELHGRFPKLAAQEGLLLANGEVRFTTNTSRSNGRLRGIMRVCY
jgi:hypothetical protein